MDREEFAWTALTGVTAAAVTLAWGLLDGNLEPVTGTLDALRSWSRGLSDHDRRMCEWAVAYGADLATFGCMCALDGVCNIGVETLTLTDGTEPITGQGEGEYLHDLYLDAVQQVLDGEPSHHLIPSPDQLRTLPVGGQDPRVRLQPPVLPVGSDIDALAVEFVGGMVDSLFAAGGIGEIVNPSGSKPQVDLVMLHEWWKGLDATARRHVPELLTLATDLVLFEFLRWLDGSRDLGQTGLHLVADECAVLTEHGHLTDIFMTLRTDQDLF